MWSVSAWHLFNPYFRRADVAVVVHLQPVTIRPFHSYSKKTPKSIGVSLANLASLRENAFCSGESL